jgi:three-Cys-motif partner protein
MTDATVPFEQLQLIECEPTSPGAAEKGFRSPLYPLWTQAKAQLIARYMRLFVQVTKHGTYVDGFAGPQSDQENWSARLVLEMQPAWLRHFYLCDIDAGQVEHLRELERQHPNRGVRIVPGDFNVRVDEMLQLVTPSEATFCLLDQRTFECHWASLQKIAARKPSGRKVEVFYFLANYWLDRSLAAITTDEGRERVAAWWGRADWAQLGGMAHFDRAQLFADRFKRELGYTFVRPWPIYDWRQGRRLMYYMIHGSDHPEAPAFMGRAYNNAVRPVSNAEQLCAFDLSQYEVGPVTASEDDEDDDDGADPMG